MIAGEGGGGRVGLSGLRVFRARTAGLGGVISGGLGFRVSPRFPQRRPFTGRDLYTRKTGLGVGCKGLRSLTCMGPTVSANGRLPETEASFERAERKDVPCFLKFAFRFGVPLGCELKAQQLSVRGSWSEPRLPWTRIRLLYTIIHEYIYIYMCVCVSLSYKANSIKYVL